MSKTKLYTTKSKLDNSLHNSPHNSLHNSPHNSPHNSLHNLSKAITAIEKEAEQQLKQYYPIHTRQEHWDSLATLNWRNYKHEVQLPSSRWSEDIQLGSHGRLRFYLRGTHRLLHYRSNPMTDLESGGNNEEVASTESPNPKREHGDLSHLASGAASSNFAGSHLGRDGTGTDNHSMRGDTGVGDISGHEPDSLASSDVDAYSTSTDSNFTQSDDEDDDQPRGRVMIQIQFPEASSKVYASPIFAQLGLVTVREHTDEEGSESGAEWPTGYHLAVNLDNEYKTAAVWFLSTRSCKVARNKYISPSSQQMPHFAAAQVATSLGEMNQLPALELTFVNEQEIYTLVDQI